ncbi:MAG: hypothetical protein QXN55_01270 [Candidatus Nitrosotenuis sp.]
MQLTDFSDWVEYDEQYSPGCIVEGNVTVDKVSTFKTCGGAPRVIKLEYAKVGGHLEKALDIVSNHYSSKDRELLECKADLIENGLGEYAKL